MLMSLTHYYYYFLVLHITRTTKITVQLPEVECEDGSKITPLKVTFPEGQGQCFFFIFFYIAFSKLFYRFFSQ